MSLKPNHQRVVMKASGGLASGGNTGLSMGNSGINGTKAPLIYNTFKANSGFENDSKVTPRNGANGKNASFVVNNSLQSSVRSSYQCGSNFNNSFASMNLDSIYSNKF